MKIGERRGSGRHRGHALSRYAAATEGVIEVCQQDYAAGHKDVGREIPYLDPTTATLIAIQSLAADALLDAPPPVLLAAPFGPLDDWSLAVLAELLLSSIGEISDKEAGLQESRAWLTQRAWDALEQALDSPTASPLLWYEDIFCDLAERYRLQKDPRAIALLKRGLAHSLRHDKGANAANFLRDLAEMHLYRGDLDQGLKILTGLLRHDPANIWTYNTAGFALGHAGLAELGLEATRRGLEVIAATGDPEKLRDQFLDCLADLRQNQAQGREGDLNPATLAGFRAALALDTSASPGQPIAALCRELVPDRDQVPVKEPPELPAPSLQSQGRQHPLPQPRRPARRARKGKKRR